MEKNEVYIDGRAIVEDGAHIGSGTRIWINSQVRGTAVIGNNCNIGKDTYIDSDVIIGDNVKIQNGVSVYHGVTIQDDVFVGPNAVFTNDFYPRAFVSDFQVRKTLVKKGASIGANATVVCGNTLGEYSMVGAGSVVTKNVPPFCLVVGNPARVIGRVCRCGNRLSDDETLCPVCGFSIKSKSETL